MKNILCRANAKKRAVIRKSSPAEKGLNHISRRAFYGQQQVLHQWACHPGPQGHPGERTQNGLHRLVNRRCLGHACLRIYSSAKLQDCGSGSHLGGLSKNRLSAAPGRILNQVPETTFLTSFSKDSTTVPWGPQLRSSAAGILDRAWTK